MVADIYTQPEKEKTNQTLKNTNEKKGGLLSGFFGSKK